MDKKTKYTWGKRTRTIEQWAKEPDLLLRGLDAAVLRARLQPPAGHTVWDVDEAFSTPVILSSQTRRYWADLVAKNPRLRKRLTLLVAEHEFVPLAVLNTVGDQGRTIEGVLEKARSEADSLRKRVLSQMTELAAMEYQIKELTQLVDSVEPAVEHMADVLEWAESVAKDEKAHRRATDRLVAIATPVVQQIEKFLNKRKNAWTLPAVQWEAVSVPAMRAAVRLWLGEDGNRLKPEETVQPAPAAKEP